MLKKKNNDINDFMNDVKNLSVKDTSKVKSFSQKNDGKILKYVIFDEDDDMVKLIKETINEKNITLQEVYNTIGTEGSGWNLVYGLRTRHSISYEGMEKWANVLDMKIEIKLIDR